MPEDTRQPWQDEEISALVDGELAADRAAELRAQAAGDPALARRIAAFEAVGAALRGLPSPGVSDDLAARTHAQLAAVPALARSTPRRRRFGYAAAGAALAAGIALLLLFRSQSEAPREGPNQRGELAAPQPEVDPDAGRLAESPEVEQEQAPPEALQPAESFAANPVVEEGPTAANTVPLAPSPSEQEAPTTGAFDLAGIPEEDLAVALDLETLSELDLIQDLEILELLDLLEGGGSS